MIAQLLLTAFLTLVLVYAWSVHRTVPIIGLLASGAALAGLYFVWVPEHANALAAFAGVLAAQTISGFISGTITDASGAVIANAKITLTNEANGGQRDTVSNDTASRFVLISAIRKSFHTVYSMNPRITPYVVPRIPSCHPVTSLISLRLGIGQTRLSTSTVTIEKGTPTVAVSGTFVYDGAAHPATVAALGGTGTPVSGTRLI